MNSSFNYVLVLKGGGAHAARAPLPLTAADPCFFYTPNAKLSQYLSVASSAIHFQRNNLLLAPENIWTTFDFEHHPIFHHGQWINLFYR